MEETWFNVTWQKFTSSIVEKDGITKKFEDLCRQLFINEFFEGNIYPHSNPNNPGIEIEPLFINDQWISFQAKFFESRINYISIYNSAENIVKYYDGKLDCIYFFCNKKISIKAKKYKETIELLKEHDINLTLIDDDAILDLIRKYPYLCYYYFETHNISPDWLLRKNANAFDQLGQRFNQKFNVSTKNLQNLSLFVTDNNAVIYINEKKENLQKQITAQKGYVRKEHIGFLSLLEQTVNNIKNIKIENIRDSFLWKQQIETICNTEITHINEKKKILQKQSQELATEISSNDSRNKTTYENYRQVLKELREVEMLMELPSLIEITPAERSLLDNNFLIIEGYAGMGKSQLLAYEAKYLQEKEKRNSLLLLAESCRFDIHALKQIMDVLNCKFDFAELIKILEAIGQKQGKIIPIFIDGLNESRNKQMWIEALLQINEELATCKYVKFACSLRSEYESMLLHNSIIKEIEKNKICKIEVEGFEENSVEAIAEFFNHYNIPFGLSELFDYNMANPLFLTLYCNTYTKDGDTNLSILYKKFISKANANIYKSLPALTEKGYMESQDILTPLIQDIVTYYKRNESKSITEQEILKLPYWKDYKIDPVPYWGAVIKEGIFRRYSYKDELIYSFAFDQMNDYFIADKIVTEATSKTKLKEYIAQNFLDFENVKTTFFDVGLFVNLCAFYKEKYNEECIDLLESIDKNPLYNSYYIQYYQEYLKSFLWRKKDSIDYESFLKCISTNSKYISPQTVWEVFICSSIKINHPLNANSLHNLLINYSLPQRDYMWTCYINQIWNDKSNRLYQLIELYNKNKIIGIDNEKKIELLLTLLSWLLTSSNRYLRDYTSKAMIEILKKNFNICEGLLKKFENVNDPYVYQRLYGIVFGACCKRQTSSINEYESLAEYVYNSIFTKEEIYPDILLRDYARLIIERLLYEYPQNKGIIDKSKIKPPYKSSPIPPIEKNYEESRFDGGLLHIQHSMRFERPGRLYGDFGRYIFQARLSYFDIEDELQIFNYAIHFIINELGYRNELFDKFDSNCHDLGETKKLERIGKKYQWIALYNILARLSDNYKMKSDPFSQTNTQYESPADLYLRDFDPTLNFNSINNYQLPYFNQIPQFIKKVKGEIYPDDNWLKVQDDYFLKLKDLLILEGEQHQWVLLSNYLDTGRQNLGEEKKLIQSNMWAYIITKEQEKAFLYNVNKKEDLRKEHLLTNFNQSSNIYNREYPWSPNCNQLLNNSICYTSLDTGEIETIIEKKEIPALNEILNCLIDLGYEDKEIKDFLITIIDDSLDQNHTIRKTIKKCSISELRKKKIEGIMHADNIIEWEGIYDASCPDIFFKYVPCAEIIKCLNLKQHEDDNAFYDKNGDPASFDLRFSQEIEGLVIRKDLLDLYLKETNKKLIWILSGEKSLHEQNGWLQSWSEWTGYYLYTQNHIQEHIYLTKLGGENF